MGNPSVPRRDGGRCYCNGFNFNVGVHLVAEFAGKGIEMEERGKA
jgi:hypothetical protein